MERQNNAANAVKLCRAMGGLACGFTCIPKVTAPGSYGGAAVGSRRRSRGEKHMEAPVTAVVQTENVMRILSHSPQSLLSRHVLTRCLVRPPPLAGPQLARSPRA